MSVSTSEWKDRILAAHERIRSIVLETPVVSAGQRSLPPLVKFKLENRQRTGSFKLRGAANALSLLTPEQARLGVLTSSTGNHGLAVATAARTLGIRAEVYVSPQVSAPKLQAIRDCGAEVQVVGSNPLDAELAARATARETGRLYLSPYNDPNVIAGQGTVAVELHSQLERIDAVFVAVGGGGLIGGIGAYLKAVSRHTQVIGCWPENSPALPATLRANSRTRPARSGRIWQRSGITSLWARRWTLAAARSVDVATLPEAALGLPSLRRESTELLRVRDVGGDRGDVGVPAADDGRVHEEAVACTVHVREESVVLVATLDVEHEAHPITGFEQGADEPRRGFAVALVAELGMLGLRRTQ